MFTKMINNSRVCHFMIQTELERSHGHSLPANGGWRGKLECEDGEDAMKYLLAFGTRILHMKCMRSNGNCQV